MSTQDATALLSLDDLCKVFGVGRTRAVRAVDHVSLTLQPGKTLGLVGETGSGKSTLGRLAMRLIQPTSGRIRFEGQDIASLSESRMRSVRSRMQMVFQDPYGSLDPRMNIESLIAEPLVVHGVRRSARRDRVFDAMRRVGLDPAVAPRYPHEFSGGQRQRIGIARAIVLDPALIVLDEPVSALDVSIQAQILNLLAEIQARSGVAYLFIAHDLAVVRHISDRVAVMYLGRIVELGDRDAIYARPRHPYTASLLSAVPLPDPRLERGRQRVPLIGEIGSATDVPSGCRFHPRCPRARTMAASPDTDAVVAGNVRLPKVCVELDPVLVDDGCGHACACHFPESPV